MNQSNHFRFFHEGYGGPPLPPRLGHIPLRPFRPQLNAIGPHQFLNQRPPNIHYHPSGSIPHQPPGNIFQPPPPSIHHEAPAGIHHQTPSHNVQSRSYPPVESVGREQIAYDKNVLEQLREKRINIDDFGTMDGDDDDIRLVFDQITNRSNSDVTDHQQHRIRHAGKPHELRASVSTNSSNKPNRKTSELRKESIKSVSPTASQHQAPILPDGLGKVKYPTPNVDSLRFDSSIGLRFDSTTGLHYDANSRLFFNSKLKFFLKWEQSTQTYWRARDPKRPEKSPSRDRSHDKDRVNFRDIRERQRIRPPSLTRVDRDANKLRDRSNSSLNRNRDRLESERPKSNQHPPRSDRARVQRNDTDLEKRKALATRVHNRTSPTSGHSRSNNSDKGLKQSNQHPPRSDRARVQRNDTDLEKRNAPATRVHNRTSPTSGHTDLEKRKAPATRVHNHTCPTSGHSRSNNSDKGLTHSKEDFSGNEHPRTQKESQHKNQYSEKLKAPPCIAKSQGDGTENITAESGRTQLQDLNASTSPEYASFNSGNPQHTATSLPALPAGSESGMGKQLIAEERPPLKKETKLTANTSGFSDDDELNYSGSEGTEEHQPEEDEWKIIDAILCDDEAVGDITKIPDASCSTVAKCELPISTDQSSKTGENIQQGGSGTDNLATNFEDKQMTSNEISFGENQPVDCNIEEIDWKQIHERVYHKRGIPSLNINAKSRDSLPKAPRQGDVKRESTFEKRSSPIRYGGRSSRNETNNLNSVRTIRNRSRGLQVNRGNHGQRSRHRQSNSPAKRGSTAVGNSNLRSDRNRRSISRNSAGISNYSKRIVNIRRSRSPIVRVRRNRSHSGNCRSPKEASPRCMSDRRRGSRSLDKSEERTRYSRFRRSHSPADRVSPLNTRDSPSGIERQYNKICMLRNSRSRSRNRHNRSESRNRNFLTQRSRSSNRRTSSREPSPRFLSDRRRRSRSGSALGTFDELTRYSRFRRSHSPADRVSTSYIRGSPGELENRCDNKMRRCRSGKRHDSDDNRSRTPKVQRGRSSSRRRSSTNDQICADSCYTASDAIWPVDSQYLSNVQRDTSGRSRSREFRENSLNRDGRPKLRRSFSPDWKGFATDVRDCPDARSVRSERPHSHRHSSKQHSRSPAISRDINSRLPSGITERSRSRDSHNKSGERESRPIIQRCYSPPYRGSSTNKQSSRSPFRHTSKDVSEGRSTDRSRMRSRGSPNRSNFHAKPQIADGSKFETFNRTSSPARRHRNTDVYDREATTHSRISVDRGGSGDEWLKLRDIRRSQSPWRMSPKRENDYGKPYEKQLNLRPYRDRSPRGTARDCGKQLLDKIAPMPSSKMEETRTIEEAIVARLSQYATQPSNVETSARDTQYFKINEANRSPLRQRTPPINALYTSRHNRSSIDRTSGDAIRSTWTPYERDDMRSGQVSGRDANTRHHSSRKSPSSNKNILRDSSRRSRR